MSSNAAWPFPTEKPQSTKSTTIKAATAENVRYMHFRNTADYSYTVAYRPTVKGNHPNFVDLAVAVCSPEDNFSRKLGRELALSRLNNGEYITLPLARFGLVYATDFLVDMFGALQ